MTTHKCLDCDQQTPIRFARCYDCHTRYTNDPNDTDSRKIEELELPKGIQDLILLHTIFTIGELRRMAKSFRLKEIHGIGPEKAAVIGEALAKACL